MAPDQQRPRLGEGVGRTARLAYRDRKLSRFGTVVSLGALLMSQLDTFITDDEFVIDRVGVLDDESDGRSRLELEMIGHETRVTKLHVHHLRRAIRIFLGRASTAPRCR